MRKEVYLKNLELLKKIKTSKCMEINDTQINGKLGDLQERLERE